MIREEQIKQYCADQGFPYGACSSISSLKANIATEAIKWADKHPNGSLIKWQTGEPKSHGRYFVQTKEDGFQIAFWSAYVKTWSLYHNSEIMAWCKLSDIEPYKEGKE